MNNADVWGGVYRCSRRLTLTNSVFEANQAASGAGRNLEETGAHAPAVNISNTRIVNNHTLGFAWGDEGGGLRVAGAAPTLTETTVQSNSAKVGAGIRRGRLTRTTNHP